MKLFQRHGPATANIDHPGLCEFLRVPGILSGVIQWVWSS